MQFSWNKELRPIRSRNISRKGIIIRFMFMYQVCNSIRRSYSITEFLDRFIRTLYTARAMTPLWNFSGIFCGLTFLWWNSHVFLFLCRLNREAHFTVLYTNWVRIKFCFIILFSWAESYFSYFILGLSGNRFNYLYWHQFINESDTILSLCEFYLHAILCGLNIY